MRKAMFHAVVGDDGYGEDPTVKGRFLSRILRYILTQLGQNLRRWELKYSAKKHVFTSQLD